MISITYLLLCHNEEQIFTLINFIKKYKDKEDKLVVLLDPSTEEYTKKLKQQSVKLVQHKLDKDYSTHRNYALDYCNGDYILALDADEQPTEILMKKIKTIIENQGRPDMIWIPRMNIFNNVLPIHAIMYGWSLQGNICNWPDMQTRLFRNKKGIKWVGSLHERLKLEKHHKVIKLSINEDLHIIHTKTIETQLKDNLRYNTEFSQKENSGISTKELLQ